MGAALSLADCEAIIDFEVRRFGPIVGFDKDDLKQELRVVASRCLPRLSKENTGRTYVRRSIRNALKNLKRAAQSFGRLPHDTRGKSLPFWYLDDRMPDGESTYGEIMPAAGPTPEQQVSARQLLSKLDEHLKDDERALLTLFMQDAVKKRDDKTHLAMLLDRCAQILHRVASDEGEKTMATVQIPKTPKDELPTCHVDGEEAVGYETDLQEAEACQDCPDKFTCLPKSIDTGLIEATLDIDPEVAAVLAGHVTFDVAMERVIKRQDLRENGGSIPSSLKYNAIQIPEESDEEETMTEEPTAAPPKKKAAKKKTTKKKPAAKAKSNGAAKKTTKKAATKKTTKKAAAKKTTKKKPTKKKTTKKAAARAATKAKRATKKATKKTTAKKKPAKKTTKKKAAAKSKSKKTTDLDHGHVRVLDDGRLEKWDGRFLPAPKEISKEKVLEHLESKIRLGLDFDLGIGMKLKMKRRDGSEAVIAITSKGYKVEKGIDPADHISVHGNLPDKATFSSLSAACMWTSPTFRTVSCNDVFNFEKHSNIEISGKGVPGKKFRKGDA